MHRFKTKYIFIFFLFYSAYFASGQIPGGCYDDATGKTGEDLKTAFHGIISAHLEHGYNDLRDFVLAEGDADPGTTLIDLSAYQPGLSLLQVSDEHATTTGHFKTH